MKIVKLYSFFLDLQTELGWLVSVAGNGDTEPVGTQQQLEGALWDTEES